MRSVTVAIVILFGMVVAGVAQQEGVSTSTVEPDPAVVEKIEELGGKIMRVAQNEAGLEISFHLGRNQEGLRQHDTSQTDTSVPPALDGELTILKGLKHVLSLHLGGTDVTDVGLAHLAGLTSLKRLHLEKTKVSDDGLAHLANLENLSYLNLYQTGVTDASLPHLEGLKNLKNLYLWKTQVTADGVEKLQQALPECEIDLGWEEQAKPAESAPDA